MSTCHRTFVQSLFVAKPKKPGVILREPQCQIQELKGQPQQRQSQACGQAESSESQNPTAPSTSTELPPADSNITTGGAASMQSSPAVKVKFTWWARFVLFVCCLSTQQG
ncbi:hypothetical protein M405DRAFT_812424 [Rhizopogon salebrosus TDB-379]|nr:hypothetical protein M405DRAFT_812424 [Rhizopogon salebrosus TDB-379]